MDSEKPISNENFSNTVEQYEAASQDAELALSLLRRDVKKKDSEIAVLRARIMRLAQDAETLKEAQFAEKILENLIADLEKDQKNIISVLSELEETRVAVEEVSEKFASQHGGFN